MGFFSKTESYLGIDIGANGIKVVELRKNKGRPQLWTYGIVDKAMDVHVHASQEKTVEQLLREKEAKRGVVIESNDDKKDPTSLQELVLQDKRIAEYAELLKILMQKARIQSRRVTSSLPVSYVFHAILNLPAVDEKQLDGIIKAEIAKMIPRPIEEMQVVHQKVSPIDPDKKAKYSTYLVTAAPKVLVAFYTAIFQKAGLQLEELETEAFALARSLVGKDSTVSMVVDVGAERTNFFIIDGGVPMTHRSLQLGGNNIDAILSQSFGVEIDQVKQIKNDMSLQGMNTREDLFLPILDPMAKEIQYSFDLYLRQSGNEQKRPEKIILTGGGGLFPPIQSYIQKQFPLRVFIGDPWARVIYQDGLKPILDELGPRMSVCIGLGLRHFS
ncbi:MAG: pilus assembly protein PilM [Candidatus Magasanikbacteria bacterium]